MEKLCGPASLAKAVGPIATAAATRYNTGTRQRTAAGPCKRTKGCAHCQTGAQLWEVHNV